MFGWEDQQPVAGSKKNIYSMLDSNVFFILDSDF